MSTQESRWDKIQRLFEAAVSMDRVARDAYLAEACGEDRGLAQAVCRLLDADKSADAVLGEVPKTIHRKLKPAFLEAEQRIGPHKILGQIGVGGMGVVYRARDTRLEREVALKFLTTHGAADDVARQRLMSEARAASRLDHVNICVIHDIDETEDGQLYITMPYYAGETLENRISRGPVPANQALDIVTQMADGLAAAHAADVIHRDIKPANVMLLPDGGLKILDFGVAKVADVKLTKTGVSIGTVSYMSPEQAAGKSVDARSDVWALGATFFEILTGKRAFAGEAIHEIIYAVLYSDDLPVNRLPMEIPASLRQVLARCLARDVDQRYSNAGDLHQELLQIKAHNAPATTTLPLDGNHAEPSASGYQWDPGILSIFEEALTPHFGPIAVIFVKRAARRASNMPQLRKRLLEHFEDQDKRNTFGKLIEIKLASHTSPPVPCWMNSQGELAGIELSPAEFAQLEAVYTGFMGPIAGKVLRRLAIKADSREALYAALAEKLDREAERKLFMTAARKTAPEDER